LTIYHLYLIDNSNVTVRLNIKFPQKVEDFIKERYGKIKFGITNILTKFYGSEFILRIDGLVGLEIFKNRQQAILFAVNYFYLSENKIIIGD
jgi:hypothetical protein